MKEFARLHAERAQTLSKQMFGFLVEQFVRDVLADSDGGAPEPATVDQPWLAMSSNSMSLIKIERGSKAALRQCFSNATNWSTISYRS